ncbi:MAG TPA: YkoF family thiamine/hydroxymethylpyrimidine-binding protein [Steroidobacteraceae bacterium]|jgi:uncharacterized protein YqgV (UPF0045/DUF77 family)|nr:YkoF family thiamine/hydroxymethylpyrimidine-binding protein [Steroidobacteraceae bacterium]
MDIGVEISLYPLTEQYLGPIREIVARLNADQRLRVVTNSMSTQVFGEYELVMQTLARELRGALAGGQRTVLFAKFVGPLED